MAKKFEYIIRCPILLVRSVKIEFNSVLPTQKNGASGIMSIYQTRYIRFVPHVGSKVI
jgi:hypothetical protein